MLKPTPVQKLQGGGTYKYVSAPLPDDEQGFKKLETDPSKYLINPKLPTPQLPEIDISTIMEADGLENDKQYLLNEIEGYKKELVSGLKSSPVFLETNRGMEILSRLQNSVAMGPSMLKRSMNSTDESSKTVKENEAWNEWVMTNDGQIVAEDANGKVVYLSGEDILDIGKIYKPIYNNEILSAEGDQRFVFDYNLKNATRNTIGLSKAMNEIRVAAEKLGDDQRGGTGFNLAQNTGGLEEITNSSKGTSLMTTTHWNKSENTRAVKSAITSILNGNMIGREALQAIRNEAIRRALGEGATKETFNQMVREGMYRIVAEKLSPRLDTKSTSSTELKGVPGSDSGSAANMPIGYLQAAVQGLSTSKDIDGQHIKTKAYKILFPSKGPGGNTVTLDRSNIGQAIDLKSITYGSEGQYQVQNPDEAMDLASKTVLDDAYVGNGLYKKTGTNVVPVAYPGSDPEAGKKILIQTERGEMRLKNAATEEEKQKIAQETKEAILDIDPSFYSNGYFVGKMIYGTGIVDTGDSAWKFWNNVEIDGTKISGDDYEKISGRTANGKVRRVSVRIPLPEGFSPTDAQLIDQGDVQSKNTPFLQYNIQENKKGGKIVQRINGRLIPFNDLGNE